MSESIWEQAAADADETLHLPGGVPLFLRRIEAGSFRMGRRGGGPRIEPVHRVEIPEPFFLGTFVVTQEQWRAVAERCARLKKEPGVDPSEFKGPRRPVERVSWEDANRFCAWLDENREEVKLPSGYHPDLPMEAEWEYACRGGKRDIRTEYWNGNGEGALREVGWYDGNAGGMTHPVDEAVLPRVPEAHPLGIFGMHGNVWEWCHDYWGRDYFDENETYRTRGACHRLPHESPTTESLGNRILRGGSWDFTASNCRAEFRFWDEANYRLRAGYFGFRLGLFSGSDDAHSRRAERCKRRPERDSLSPSD